MNVDGWAMQGTGTATTGTTSISIDQTKRQSELALIRDETSRLAQQIDQLEAAITPILSPKYETDKYPGDSEPAPLMSEIVSARINLSSLVARVVGLLERVEV